MKKKHMGSTLDSLFEELGEAEDVRLLTQKKKKLLAAKIEREMAKKDGARREHEDPPHGSAPAARSRTPA